MPILKLVAEAIGPFDRLELDFSDGNGKPHLGPHILAGVNGSGKTTALRTIAWLLSKHTSGFPLREYWHLVREDFKSRVLMLEYTAGLTGKGFARTTIEKSANDELRSEFREWAHSAMPGHSFPSIPISTTRFDQSSYWSAEFGRSPETLAAAYRPSPMLKYLQSPRAQHPGDDPFRDALAFEGTVKNEYVQSLLINRTAIGPVLASQGKDSSAADGAKKSFERALSSIFSEPVALTVDGETFLQPRIVLRGQTLNFSQLPDGVNAVLGYLADYSMRFPGKTLDEAGGVMIIDEIESHLHPRWQRRILPALKAALPKTQIIVATHSPFVISSTEDAIVHILDWDKKNHNAFLRERIRAPFGQSLQATLMDVFGVDSEFDQETEQDLDRWDTLRRKSRTAQEEKEFKRLAKMLAARSEELRFIVGSSLEPIAQLAVPKKQRRKAS